MPPKKAIQKKEPKEEKQDNEPKRADYKLRNYTEDNLLEDMSKIQNKLKKLQQSINEHDSELEIKRNDHKKLQQELKDMETIKELLTKIQV